jgi:hypothetical protein
MKTKSPAKKKTTASRTAKAVGSGRLVSVCRACEIFDDGPCSPKLFEHLQNKAARAIHAEHNRHEGTDTPWIGLHRFQRDKYRAKAYAALVAIGIPAPANDAHQPTRRTDAR